MFGKQKVCGTKVLTLEKRFFARQDGGVGPCYNLKELTEMIGRAKGEVLAGMDGAQQLEVKFAISFRPLQEGNLCVEFHYEHPPLKVKPKPEDPEHYELRRLITKHPALARQLIK